MQSIETNNAIKRFEILRIVDNPINQRKIRELRKKWDIHNLLDPDKNKISDFAKHLSKNSDNTWEEFLNDIDEFRISLKKDENYKNLFIYILGFSKIPDRALKTCYLEITKRKNITKTAIVVYPFTQVEDIKILLSDLNNKYKLHAKLKTELDIRDLGYAYDPYLREAEIAKLNEYSMARELFYIRFGDLFEGISDEPKTIEETMDVWVTGCPNETMHKSKEEEDECIYCRYGNNFEKTKRLLRKYEALIETNYPLN